MKDSELRGYILQYFYDRRRERSRPAPKAADLGVEVDEQDILHVCDQLGELNYLDWKSQKSTDYEGDYFLGGIGKINAYGIDIVEENATPDIKVEFVQHNNNAVTISGSTNVNNIIGSNNTLTLSELAKAIESAEVSPQEKEEAKSLLNNLLNHPLVATLVGSAAKIFTS
jgi:hypothetical protein